MRRRRGPPTGRWTFPASGNLAGAAAGAAGEVAARAGPTGLRVLVLAEPRAGVLLPELAVVAAPPLLTGLRGLVLLQPVLVHLRAGAGAAGAGAPARGRGAAPAAPVDPNAIPNSGFGEVAGRGYPLPMQPWAAELKKKRMADNSKDNPDVWCLPIGLMQYHNHPQPRQIVHTKNLMLITYESNYGLRYIYLDGRPAPNNDPTPWWFGYSRGWWEGNDTLVVETTNFRGDERAGWLDVNGSPYTEALKMTERFRRPNFGTLQIDVTIDDPKAYTRPFTVRVNHRIMVDTEMFEFICNENEKSTEHIAK